MSLEFKWSEAHDKLKVTLLAYNTVYNYDVSDSQLWSSVENTEIHIEGFSHEVFRKDHPDDKCKGGVCLYYKENLPITNLEIIEETIVCKINVRRKKAYFVVVYRSPSQTDDEFDLFIDKLELTIENIQAKKPDCIIITGDFNCKSQKWWSDGIEDKHGSTLDVLIQSKNLTQLINEPTHLLNNSRSCIDLIITSQDNLFIDYGIHPSLFERCHYEIIHGKLNLTVLPPPAYK